MRRWPGELYDSISSIDSAPGSTVPSTLAAIVTAVGSVVRVMGPRLFLDADALPLVVSAPSAGGYANGLFREWLVPVLRTHVKACRPRLVELGFFGSHLLELARAADERARACGAAEATEAQQLRVRVAQLWSTLPSFCEGPSDVDPHFGALAPSLEQILLRPDLAAHVGAVCNALQVCHGVFFVRRRGRDRDGNVVDSGSRRASHNDRFD